LTGKEWARQKTENLIKGHEGGAKKLKRRNKKGGGGDQNSKLSNPHLKNYDCWQKTTGSRTEAKHAAR